MLKLQSQTLFQLNYAPNVKQIIFNIFCGMGSVLKLARLSHTCKDVCADNEQTLAGINNQNMIQTKQIKQFSETIEQISEIKSLNSSQIMKIQIQVQKIREQASKNLQKQVQKIRKQTSKAAQLYQSKIKNLQRTIFNLTEQGKQHEVVNMVNYEHQKSQEYENNGWDIQDYQNRDFNCDQNESDGNQQPNSQSQNNSQNCLQQEIVANGFKMMYVYPEQSQCFTENYSYLPQGKLISRNKKCEKAYVPVKSSQHLSIAMNVYFQVRFPKQIKDHCFRVGITTETKEILITKGQNSIVLDNFQHTIQVDGQIRERDVQTFITGNSDRLSVLINRKAKQVSWWFAGLPITQMRMTKKFLKYKYF